MELADHFPIDGSLGSARLPLTQKANREQSGRDKKIPVHTAREEEVRPDEKQFRAFAVRRRLRPLH
jgi:hypothetical protein